MEMMAATDPTHLLITIIVNAAQFPGPIAPAILDYLSGLFVLKVGLERLVLSGRVRMTLIPLMSTPPLVGSVQVSADPSPREALCMLPAAHVHSPRPLPVADYPPAPSHRRLHPRQVALTEVPKFSFDLTVYGGDISVLPGLEAWLHGLIQDAVLRPYCLPERYVFPLISPDALAADRPAGLLEVTVVEAEHVPRMDLLSRSDPYVQLSVRDKRKVKTQVKDNAKHPVWEEEVKLLVHYPEHQSLTAVLYDYDVFDRDDVIGRCGGCVA